MTTSVFLLELGRRPSWGALLLARCQVSLPWKKSPPRPPHCCHRSERGLKTYTASSSAEHSASKKPAFPNTTLNSLVPPGPAPCSTNRSSPTLPRRPTVCLFVCFLPRSDTNHTQTPKHPEITLRHCQRAWGNRWKEEFLQGSAKRQRYGWSNPRTRRRRNPLKAQTKVWARCVVGHPRKRRDKSIPGGRREWGMPDKREGGRDRCSSETT